MSSEAIRLRDASSRDPEALTALMLASSAYDGPYQAIIRSYPVTLDMVSRNVIRIAEQGCKIMGFYSLSPRDADLDLMFVADAAQGLGIGRRLFEDMADKARAKGLDTVSIVAHPPAAPFYRKMGAIDCGMKPAGGVASWDRPVLRLALT